MDLYNERRQGGLQALMSTWLTRKKPELARKEQWLQLLYLGTEGQQAELIAAAI